MLEFVDEVAEDDRVFEGHGVKVIVDAKSLAYLDGTELDFLSKKGLMKALNSLIPMSVANAAVVRVLISRYTVRNS